MLFLLLASPWFILIDILFFGLIVFLTEREMGTVAGVVLAIATAAYFFFAGINPLGWLLANIGNVFIGAGIYLLLGIGWSIFKWFFYTRKDETQNVIRELHAAYKKAAKAHDKNEEFVRVGNPTHVVEAYPYTFQQWLKENSFQNPLDPSKNKIRITRWMIWWPTSIIWTVLSDLVINIFNFIYDKLAFVFKSILDGQIKRALKDVE